MFCTRYRLLFHAFLHHSNQKVQRLRCPDTSRTTIINKPLTQTMAADEAQEAADPFLVLYDVDESLRSESVDTVVNNATTSTKKYPPDRSKCKQSNTHPLGEEDSSYFLSRLFFTWENPMFVRASKLHKEGFALEHKDLLRLPKYDHSASIGPEFDIAWEIANEKIKGHLGAVFQGKIATDNKDNARKKKQNESASSKDSKAEISMIGVGSGDEKHKDESNLDTQALQQQQRQLSPTPQQNNDISAEAGASSTKRLRLALLQIMGPSFYTAGLIKAVNTALQFCFPILLNSILRFIEETTQHSDVSSSNNVIDDDPWYVAYKGYCLSGILFAVMGSKAITESAYFHIVNKCGYRVKMAVSIATYQKALRLANAERQSTTLGGLINLMQVDATKIEAFIPQLHVLWDGLFQIIGYLTILYTLIGWPCFAGVFVMVCAGPMQMIIMGKMYGLNRQVTKYMDERVETTNECLQGIQCVKMYTWEDSFQSTIENLRLKELTMLRRLAYLRGFARAYMGALPGVVAVTSFVVYALAYSAADVSASTLFAALVAFDQLRFPLLFYPMTFALMSQAQVSAARVETFLNMKEVTTITGIGSKSLVGTGTYTRISDNDDEEDDNHNEDHTKVIDMKSATIYWNDPTQPMPLSTDDRISESGDVSVHGLSSTTRSGTCAGSIEDNSSSNGSVAGIHGDDDIESPTVIYPKPILKNVTISVKKGELCAVVGRVASGKSTLCSAILNEALLVNGEVVLRGSKVAYAAQTPWILNATLRENILFGLDMDEMKYRGVIRACQLEHDLKLLDDGDLTEIGERGINLSGGQKQRISVARAAYSDASIIILDDPLSALDPEVGKNLFEECIVGLLGDKTVIFVTNQLQYLQKCDTVVALGGKRVLEQGTCAQLMSNESGEVKRLLSKLAKQHEKEQQMAKEVGDDGNVKKSSNEKKTSRDGTKGDGGGNDLPLQSSTASNDTKKVKDLLTMEERNVGAVSLSVYLKYMLAGGGYLKFAFLFFAFVATSANQLAMPFWVSFWTSDATYKKFPEAFYLGIYFALAVTLGMFTFNSSFKLVRFANQASQRLHHNLLHSVLRAPQSFFDTTPLGRILSRFSKDMSSIDLEVGEYFDFFLFSVIQVTFSLCTIMIITPWFGVAIVPLAFLYVNFMNYFREVSRETKRLESISRSPVYALFSEVSCD